MGGIRERRREEKWGVFREQRIWTSGKDVSVNGKQLESDRAVVCLKDSNTCYFPCQSVSSFGEDGCLLGRKIASCFSVEFELSPIKYVNRMLKEIKHNMHWCSSASRAAIR